MSEWGCAVYVCVCARGTCVWVCTRMCVVCAPSSISTARPDARPRPSVSHSAVRPLRPRAPWALTLSRSRTSALDTVLSLDETPLCLPSLLLRLGVGQEVPARPRPGRSELAGWAYVWACIHSQFISL